MIGHIYIKGQIGSFQDVKGVELIDLVMQVQRQKDAEVFFVYVDSPGGSIDEGDNMYNYLKSLPQRITTVGIGMVASIATKPMLAGDERIMIEGQSELMVHNPWADGVKGDAEELMSAAERIREEEDKLISFYNEVTGISKEGLDALMKSETYLTPEKALELGFITKIIKASEMTALGMVLPTAQPTEAKVKAFAFKKTDTMSKEILSKIDQMLAFFKKEDKTETKKLALMVADSNGVQVEIKKADGSEITGQPIAGDLCTVEGQPAEGTYIFPDMGISIDAKAGVISAVNPIEAAKVDPANDPNSPEYLKTELAKAQAKILEQENQIKENETFKTEVETKFALIEKGLKSTASGYVPQGRTTEFREEKKNTPVEITKESMKKRREGYKKQNEK